MSDSPTPLTDKEAQKTHGTPLAHYVRADFARCLERQRDEAKDEIWCLTDERDGNKALANGFKETLAERDEQLAELTARWEKAANAYLIEKRQHEATQGQLEEARTALEDIAKQRLASEMDDHSSECADWEGGYEACVTTAREALALIDAKGKKTP